MKTVSRIAILIIAVLLFVSCNVPTATPTTVPTETLVPTVAPTAISTATPVPTIAPTAVPTVTPMPTIDICARDMKAWYTQINPSISEFSSAYFQAASAGHTDLDSNISAMKTARQKVADVAVPACGIFVRTALLEGFQGAINGWSAVSAGEPVAVARDHFVKGLEAIKAAIKAYFDITGEFVAEDLTF